MYDCRVDGNGQVQVRSAQHRASQKWPSFGFKKRRTIDRKAKGRKTKRPPTLRAVERLSNSTPPAVGSPSVLFYSPTELSLVATSAATSEATMGKTRVGVLLRESVGGNKSSNKSQDLASLVAKYHEFCKKIRALIDSLKAHHGAMQKIEQSRSLVSPFMHCTSQSENDGQEKVDMVNI